MSIEPELDPSLVIVEASPDGIHRVRLNRPEKRNALSIELRNALADVFARLADDPHCEGVVLMGEGTAFCAGMDFTQFGGDRKNKQRLFESTRDLFGALLDFPKRIVAGVHGAAVGGGFMLALCCDQRVASPDAYFGFFEVGRGIPAPLAIVRLFVEEARARSWCESGRKIGAREAFEAGVVARIVESEALEETCREEAQRASLRRVAPALRSAFAGEMSRFGRALFPSG
jgi:enoyl-CoA hydratase/carnithine racemase